MEPIIDIKHKLKHLLYTGGWKKFEPVWNLLIKTKNLNNMLPLLESILSKVNPKDDFVLKTEDKSRAKLSLEISK